MRKKDQMKNLVFETVQVRPVDKSDLKNQRRRTQQERQKSNRFNNQNLNFSRALRFSFNFVHFFAVTARLRSENA